MNRLLLFALTGLLGTTLRAQPSVRPQPYSQRMADSFTRWFPDSIVVGSQKAARWDYEQGLMLLALQRVWERTADARYLNYIVHDIDQFVGPDGQIRTYRPDDNNLDNLTPGRVLLMLAQQTIAGRERYQRAAQTLRQQLATQPRTKAGGFWHKQRYPNQMWLDGLYMAEPFYAEYSAVYGETANFDDIAQQFALIEQHLPDPKTGLLYHGYDESRQQPWANPQSGQSPNVWGRAMGWYAMALVDVLDYVPADHPQRAKLVGYLQRLAPVVARYQDTRSGLWYQVMDKGAEKGNYLEASASCMFVYALAKGARLGYLPASFAQNARNGYAGIVKTFVVAETDGTLSLNGTVSVGGLGGNPYRDGSYAYYLSEPLRKNDLKGVGPFIMASLEVELMPGLAVGRGKTVGIDTYFNHETRVNPFALAKPATTALPDREPYHYTWEDRMHSGFWWWGNLIREQGARTVSVPVAPSAQSLKGIDVYILSDPDTPKETPQPNYISAAHRQALAGWVRAGGVLVLMANDTANCETRHLNELAQTFGIRFTDKSRNLVQGTKYEQGTVAIAPGNPVFPTTRTTYLKELSVLAVQPPARAVVSAEGEAIMAVASYGKGLVFAVGDPWLYNEYIDGRRIAAPFQNALAAQELTVYLLNQVRRPVSSRTLNP